MINKGIYRQFQEVKLLARRNKESVSAVTYYYDMIAPMTTFDRGMNELTKVNQLKGGFCSCLTKRLYSLEINTTAKFLNAVKLGDEKITTKERRGTYTTLQILQANFFTPLERFFSNSYYT